MFVGEDCEGEVNQKDQSYRSMKVICNEGRFETTNSCVDND
jgi:hypothetical protein